MMFRIVDFPEPDASTGDILLDGVRINDIPTNKRDVHTVFQSYALFPHMNVFENVAFPLRLRKIDKKEIEQRVAEVLKMVQLEGYEKRSGKATFSNTFICGNKA